jgi:DNA-binding Lrp family transcriptional regulator
MQLMGPAAADRIGINATDLNCLNILSFSGRMTAGELARATGLTTASITGVVDRLEEAGYVTRERDPHDRRRVVVQVVLERRSRTWPPSSGPMIRDWQEVAAHYSDDELRLIVDFYGRMEEVFRHHLAGCAAALSRPSRNAASFRRPPAATRRPGPARTRHWPGPARHAAPAGRLRRPRLTGSPASATP